MEIVTAKSRYTSLALLRAAPVERAREAAALTIPSLFPPEGTNDNTRLDTPSQSIGARGLNNLASKFLLTLLPPNAPFFKLLIDEQTLEELTQKEGMRAEVDSALGKIERAVMNRLEAIASRPVISDGMKQLILAGNALMFNHKGTFRMYRLDKYVVKRDPAGSAIEIVIKESVSPSALPPHVRELVQKDTDQKVLDIYTYVKREDTKWTSFQEINDEKLPESEGTYSLEACPWTPLRFSYVDGEDYGRGYIEEYMGDLIAANGLQKAITEGSAAAVKLLLLVDPNGITSAKTIAEAPNGAVRSGRADDVSTLQSDKAADLRVALEALRDIIQRLSYAFLLNSSIQRSGERVTAEEIRYMANELEDALGGTYSILGQEFQRPLVAVTMHDLQKANKIPTLPKGTVSPSITTGIEALGRGHDLMKLDQLVGGAAQTVGADKVERWINVGDYFTRRATALGIESKGLVFTQDEVAAKDQADQEAAQQQMMNQQLMQSGGKIAENVTKEMTANG